MFRKGSEHYSGASADRRGTEMGTFGHEVEGIRRPGGQLQTRFTLIAMHAEFDPKGTIQIIPGEKKNC